MAKPTLYKFHSDAEILRLIANLGQISEVIDAAPDQIARALARLCNDRPAAAAAFSNLYSDAEGHQVFPRAFANWTQDKQEDHAIRFAEALGAQLRCEREAAETEDAENFASLEDFLTATTQEMIQQAYHATATELALPAEVLEVRRNGILPGVSLVEELEAWSERLREPGSELLELALGRLVVESLCLDPLKDQTVALDTGEPEALDASQLPRHFARRVLDGHQAVGYRTARACYFEQCGDALSVTFNTDQAVNAVAVGVAIGQRHLEMVMPLAFGADKQACVLSYLHLPDDHPPLFDFLSVEAAAPLAVRIPRVLAGRVFFREKAEYWALAHNLRRTLQSVYPDLTVTQTQELLARACGYSSSAAMEIEHDPAGVPQLSKLAEADLIHLAFQVVVNLSWVDPDPRRMPTSKEAVDKIHKTVTAQFRLIIAPTPDRHLH